MACSSSSPSFGELSDAEMEDYKKELASCYHIIMTDPRYTRMVNKVAPSFFSKQGMKKQVDPSKVPLVGTVVKGYRSKKIEKHKNSLEETQKSGSTSNVAMSTAVQSMERNMSAEAKKRHIGLAVGIAFSIVPVSSVVPIGAPVGEAAGKAGGQVAGTVATKGTEKAAQTGIKKGAQKAGEASSLNAMDSQNFESKVHAKFTKTKAFLLYVGAPKTDDALYARWESSRLTLKATYGAQEEDDLAEMEPTDEQKKEMVAIEKDDDRSYDLEALGVSLLWIFWRMYECWDTFYFDYLDERRHGSKKNRENYVKELRAKERAEDQKFLQELTIAEFPTIRRVHKTEKDFVVTMLTMTYWDHPLSRFFGEKEEEKTETLKHFWGTIFDNFLKDQEVWAIEDPASLKIRAVALIKPAPNSASSPLGATAMAKLTKKIGLRKAKEMTTNYKQREKIASSHAGKGVQVICYVGNPSTEFTQESPLTSLCKSLILRNDSPPTYVHEKGGGEKWIQFWEMCGLTKKLDVMKGEQIFWHQGKK